MIHIKSFKLRQKAVILLNLIAAWFVLAVPSACGVDWSFQPFHEGRVLDEGGWFQAYTVGTITVSPEFTFPLQLAYRNNRDKSGLFGAKWFCPQLESTILPQSEGVFFWLMPSGTVLVFMAEPNKESTYLDVSHTWMAKGDAGRIVISNQEGWKYSYDKGHLDSVLSPTNRLLQFIWAGEQLQNLQLGNADSAPLLTLLKLGYTDDNKINNLTFNGIQHQLTYQSGHEGLLQSWQIPSNLIYTFSYLHKGVLEKVYCSDGTALSFTTQLDDPKLPATDQENAAHWILVEDSDQSYSYSNKTEITMTSPKGYTESRDFNYKRGILTEKSPGGDVKKTYFYRAPGRKYDGKLRRVEVNGKVLLDNYYTRKLGLMTSSIDDQGIKTNLEYPENWDNTSDFPWDPKPIRIWQGTAENPLVLETIKYDRGGRITELKDRNGQVTQYQYDSKNQLVQFTNPLGLTTDFTYDALGRTILIKTNNLSESVEYDDFGRLKSSTSKEGTKTECTYDTLGNVAQVTRKGKIIEEDIRNAQGRLISIKDALGRIRKYEVDAQGNILTEIAADGTTTKYEYDQYNRRIAQMDGNGNKTTFSYNPVDDILVQTNPLGETIQWNYDKKFRAIQKRTAEQTISSTYDENDRLASLDYGAGQKINYTYDARGRILSAVTPETAYYHIFNPLGEIDAIRYVKGSDEQLVRFRFNPAGQRTGLLLAHLESANGSIGSKKSKDPQYDILQQTEYTYDKAGRLESIISCGVPVMTYHYDELNRMIGKVYANGITGAMTYDPMGQLSKIEFTGGPLKTPLTLAYEWDDANQVTRRTWNGEVQRYEYTLAGQLAKVINDKTGQILESYVYDKAGNMVEKTLKEQKSKMTYNAANELVSSTEAGRTFLYTYDKAGRMTKNPAGTVTTYGWLDKAIRLTGANGEQTVLNYWPDGQLAAKKSGHDQNEEIYVWDGLALLRRGDTIYITEPHANGGTVIASHPTNNPNKLTYYLNDLLGTSLCSVREEGIDMNNLSSFGQPLKNSEAVNKLNLGIRPPSVSIPVPQSQQIGPSSN